MATKKDLVNSILENDKNTLSSEELNLKTYKDLSGIVLDLEKEEKEEVVSESEPIFDMQEMMKQMKVEMMKELEGEREKIRQEAISETKKTYQKESIDRHRQVPVMNLTNGKLIYISKKSGAQWSWTSYGDIDTIDFFELQTMRTSSKSFIYDPLLMILDEEVVEYLGLKNLYDDIVNIENLDEIFDMNNNDFKAMIEKLPKTFIVSIVSKAREKDKDGTLDSRWKVKYLNEKFKTDIGERG